MFRRRIVPTLVGVVIIIALALLRLSDPYPVRVARETAFDFYQQVDPRPKGDYPVRVIDIDEASLKAIGQWPWPRSILATLTSRLGELGAAAIGFDALFPEPDRMSPRRIEMTPLGWASNSVAKLPDYDEDFAQALAATPSVMGFSVSNQTQVTPAAPKVGFAISGTDPRDDIPTMDGAVIPLDQLLASAHGLGAVSLERNDSAGVVRQLPLLWSAGKQLYPTLSVEALRTALGIPTLVVFGDTAGQGYVDSLRIGDYTVPTTASGDLTLYYSRPDPALYVSARDILGPDYHDIQPLIQGQIVLIGTSASGLLDIHTTALGDNVPGVSIHAQAIEQILSGKFLTRSDWVSGLEIASFVIIGLLIVGVIMQVGPLAGLLIGAGFLAAVVGTCWYVFQQYGLLLDPTFTTFGAFIVYSATVFMRFALTDADRRQIRRAFGNYVAPELLTQIERSGESLKLGGETRDLTVMFVDVRNFTTISESLTPEELLNMLNTLFGALGAEVMEQFGTIDKFIGDALMAFWNAPVDVPGHARRACVAALGMRRRLTDLNTTDAFGRKAAGKHPAELQIGIGMSTGPALVGNMGLETRFDYSCLGDTVNVASRVEGACKTVGYDIVIVEQTRVEAADLACLEAGSLRLKGKTAREPIHILVGDAELAKAPAFLALQQAHTVAIAALGTDAITTAIARCHELCASIDPRLAKFYDLLSDRAEDFQDDVAPAEAA